MQPKIMIAMSAFWIAFGIHEVQRHETFGYLLILVFAFVLIISFNRAMKARAKG